TFELMSVGGKGEYLGCYYRDGVKIEDYIDVKGHCAPPVQSASDLTLLRSIQVYPNPAGAALHIDHLPVMPCTLTLYDVTGRQVQQHDAPDRQPLRLDVSSLPSGIYLL